MQKLQQSCNRAMALKLLVYETLSYECLRPSAKHATELQQSYNSSVYMLTSAGLARHTCILMQAKSWHYSVVADTHTQSLSFSRAHLLSLSLPPHLSLSLSLSLSHTHTHTHVCSRMLAYARVWWRMVEWLQVGD